MSEQPDVNQQMAEVVRALSKTGREFAEAISRGFTELMATPQVQYLKTVADYYDRHPEELERFRAAREAEVRADSCHCTCQRWNHLGICTGEATTSRVFHTELLGAVPVPLCAACADDITTQPKVR